MLPKVAQRLQAICPTCASSPQKGETHAGSYFSPDSGRGHAPQAAFQAAEPNAAGVRAGSALNMIVVESIRTPSGSRQYPGMIPTTR